MPIGTCDPASRGQAYNQVAIESGPILVDIRYGWDGASVRPDCDGPVSYLRVRNTGTVTWYALLPNKRNGVKYVEIPPGTDVSLNPGQRAAAGLTTYQDCAGVMVTSTPPA